MEEVSNGEVGVEMTSEQRLQRFEAVLSLLKKDEDYRRSLVKDGELTPDNLKLVRFARGVMGAAFGSDPNPEVSFDPVARPHEVFRFDLADSEPRSIQGEQAGMAEGEK
jgi:hypothetical protein